MRACSPWLRRIASLILDSVAILVRDGIRLAFCPGYEFFPPGYVAPPSTIDFNITSLHFFTLRYISLHFITFRCISLHCVTLRYTSLHVVTFHYISLHPLLGF